MVINVEEMGWFVWNMVIYDFCEVVNLSVMVLLLYESEFDWFNVMCEYVDNVCIFMVKESLVKFECCYISIY